MWGMSSFEHLARIAERGGPGQPLRFLLISRVFALNVDFCGRSLRSAQVALKHVVKTQPTAMRRSAS